MAIVGTCKDESPNKLPARTSNSFTVFVEGDSTGLPPNLKHLEVAFTRSEKRDCVARARLVNALEPGHSIDATMQNWVRTGSIMSEAGGARQPESGLK